MSVPGWGPRSECGGDGAVSVPVAGQAGPGRDPRVPPGARGAGVAQPPPVLPALAAGARQLPGPERGAGGTQVPAGRDGHRAPTTSERRHRR